MTHPHVGARAVVFGLGVLVSVAIVGLTQRGAVAQPGPASASASGAPGKSVYDAHCVECHGTSGKGDGPASMTLVPRPRDFTSGRCKIHSTETGSLPTDDDLVRTVRQGLNGSSMPAWDKILSSDDIVAVVQYIKTLSPRFASEQPEPIASSGPAPATPESVTRGVAVYAKLQCSKCHGEDGRGTGATATDFNDDWGFPLRATNLSEPWIFHGGSTSADIFMRFRAGISGTPMPSYKGAATDAEMWDLANYVVSLRRKPVWEMNADEVTAFYKQQDAEALANPVRRGEYLATSLACPVCHSPFDSEKRMIPGMRFAGGLRMYLAPFGTYPTGNLTSDKETGLGNWTDDEIKRAVTKGILKDGTRLLPFPMDWASFSTMKESDINAIVAYLRTIPPIRNKVPRPTRTVLPLYLWGKFQMLILGADLPSYFYAGNAGIADWSPTMKRILKWAAIIVVVLAVCGFLAFLYNIPPFFLVAPEVFGADMAKAPPSVDAIADPAQRAIAERGRTLVMNNGCTGCHATNGPQGPDLTKYLSGGGIKIASKHGTFVSRNLTPDPDTGLARRTDDEVKRVLRSGTFSDGHVVSFTTMPWAGFSNWTEEDRHSVVVYLRSLPAVKHQIPEPSLAPAADLPTDALEGIFGLKDYGIN